MEAKNTMVSQEEKNSGSNSSLVKLEDEGNGIVSVHITAADQPGLLSKALIEALLAVLETVRASESVKVLLIHGTEKVFLHGGLEEHHLAIECGLYEAVSSFPYPVIAVLRGSASGAGFLFAALADFMICGFAGRYSFTDRETSLFPGSAEDAIFCARFGRVNAHAFLYQGKVFSGRQLQDKGWSCQFATDDQLIPQARQLAETLAAKSRKSLHLLKRHLTRNIDGLVKDLARSGETAFNNPPEMAKPAKIASRLKSIRMEVNRDSVLVLRIRQSRRRYFLNTLAAELKQIFSQLEHANQFKAIVLASERSGFLSESKPGRSVDDMRQLVEVLLDCPLPFVTVLDSDSRGLAWLVAQLGEATVLCESGSYSAEALFGHYELAGIASALFTYRAGEVAAKEILLTGETYSAEQLAQRFAMLLTAGKNQLMDTALALAISWADHPLSFLRDWKNRVRQELRRIHQAFSDWREPEAEPVGGPLGDEVGITLQSNVISATVHAGNILVVEMHDREAKNMFSDALVAGMNEVFHHIEQTSAYKVVVLTGFGNYFASGGTRETLLAIQQGKVKFTDEKTFQLPLTCKIPVIAAMQGHGIGAGWAMGMFADFTVLSEESRYVSPYMNYGFTPGAGATLIIPERMGQDLARESLMTAQEYSGKTLKHRGLLFPVHPRNDVVGAALHLAKRISRLDRADLIGFKSRINRHLLEQLDSIYSLEVAMHGQTFVGQDETLRQIQQRFNAGANGSEGKEQNAGKVESKAVFNDRPQTPVDAQPKPGAGTDLASVIQGLKVQLAKELHLDPDEIDEEAQFVDLGLDSITGVTWMRHINARFGTSIEAIKVYSYPSLKKFAPYVKKEAEAVADIVTSQATDKPEAAPPTNNTSRDDSTKTADAGEPVKVPLVSGSEVGDTLKKLLAEELHMQPEEIDPQAQFVDLGLDSITGVTWIRKINETFKVSIEAIKVYAYPTLTQFSAYIAAELHQHGPGVADAKATRAMPNQQKEELAGVPGLKARPETQTETRAEFHTTDFLTAGLHARRKLTSWRNGGSGSASVRPTVARNTGPIAIIGMAGQFPAARNIDEYWRNLAEGKNCITEVPRERWDVDSIYQPGGPAADKTYCKWMGHLDEYDLFDPLFFNLSPKEAASMDPQQRLLLQTCWNTLEHAGYSARSMAGSQCGVFIGGGPGDYHLLSKRLQTSALGFTGGDTSILAARISYFLDLQGPCLTLETACSSSLVALATACDSLVSGNCDTALAGGVSVMAGPTMHIKTAQSGMLSEDGRCFTFDQRANGFVPGEAVGMVMLKRLEDAERDQDRILGLIQGWGVNQDGKTNGITAPNPDSQARLEQYVYDKFQIDPADIQMIEAHGTGTKLGDPIEVDALKQAFSRYTREEGYCALGSVKSNIGHCMMAAGIASMLKVLLAIQHRQIPPTINFARLNEHINLNGSPFFINDKLSAWEKRETRARKAAVSGFGFGGTNAHIVISEYLPNRDARPATATAGTPGLPVAIPLSAKTPEQLRQRVRDLFDYLSQSRQNDMSDWENVDLVSLAYTLQTGRDAMSHRLGIAADSIGQLTQKLQAYLDAGENSHPIDGVYRQYPQTSAVRKADVTAGEQDSLYQHNAAALLEKWVGGLDIDWSRLYGNKKPMRIALPGYPFARERHWIDEEKTPAVNGDAGGLIHPLLHRNTSNLNRQSYFSSFTGAEFFLRDHRVRIADVANGPAGQGDAKPVLPAVAYLEMARAAVEDAVPEAGRILAIELRDVIWMEPLIVAEHTTGLTTVLFAEGPENAPNQEVAFEVVSDGGIGGRQTPPGDGHASVHCRGRVMLMDSPQESDRVDLAQIRQKANRDVLPADRIYKIFADMGLHYGPAHRGLVSINRGRNELLAHIKLPENANADPAEYFLHPSLMDSALQATIGLILDSEDTPGQPLLPFSIERLQIFSSCPPEIHAWVRYANSATTGKVAKFEIDLVDSRGTVLVRMAGFSTRALQPAMAQPFAKQANANGHPLASGDSGQFDEIFYKKIIDSVQSKKLSVNDAVELG